MAFSRTGTLKPAPGETAVAGLRAVLSRSWPSVIAAGTALSLVVWLAWSDGGYFPHSYTAAGAIALGVLGLLLLARPPQYSFSTAALLGLTGLIGLAVWTGLSAYWSSAPDTALEDMQRNLAYAGIFGLGLFAAGSGRLSRPMVWLVLGVMAAIVGAGLLSRLYPDLIATTTPPGDVSGYRLRYPLAYWNAFGAMAAMGAVLALGLAADPRSPVVLRPLAASLAIPLAIAMYLSLSRGAWLALGVGVAVLVAFAANRGSLLLTLGVVGGGVALALVDLQAYPALIDDPAIEEGQLASGRSYAAALVAIMLVVAAVQGVIATGRATRPLMSGVRRAGQPVLIALGTLAVVGFLALYAVEGDALDREAGERVESVKAYVGDQWDEFMAPGGSGVTGRDRLTSGGSTRDDLYRVAIDGFQANPIRGDGSGAFEYRFIREREEDEKVRDAHSLYFETLSELGLVGFAFLALLVGSMVAVAIRSRARPTSMSRSQTAAVAATIAVWVAHAGIDWDWQVPALTGAALMLAATLYPYGRSRRRRRETMSASRRVGYLAGRKRSASGRSRRRVAAS